MNESMQSTDREIGLMVLAEFYSRRAGSRFVKPDPSWIDQPISMRDLCRICSYLSDLGYLNWRGFLGANGEGQITVKGICRVEGTIW